MSRPTTLDVEHITWLKRYCEEVLKMLSILISHDIPFLNSVVNLIYHIQTKN